MHEAYPKGNRSSLRLPVLQVFPIEHQPELKYFFNPAFEFGQYRFIIRLADYTACLNYNVCAFTLWQYFEQPSYAPLLDGNLSGLQVQAMIQPEPSKTNCSSTPSRATAPLQEERCRLHRALESMPPEMVHALKPLLKQHAGGVVGALTGTANHLDCLVTGQLVQPGP